MAKNVIEAVGYGDHVLALARDKSPAAIRKALTADSDFMAKMEGIGRRRVYASDVTVFLATRANEATAALTEVGGTNAALAAVAAKEHVLDLIAMGEDFSELTKRGMALLNEALDKYEEAAEADPDGKHQFPFGLWEMARKSMATSVSMGKSLATDQRVIGIVKAGTVNVNQGMTTEDVHDLLFAVGARLGVPERDMLNSYTGVLMDRNRRRNGKVVDTETATTPKMMARMPFVRAVEDSLGLPVKHPESQQEDRGAQRQAEAGAGA